MSEELKTLNRKRGLLKSRQTLLKKYLDGLAKDSLGNIVENEIILELEIRFDKFVSILQEFDEVQGSIEMLVDESDLEEQQTEREQFEDVYFKLCTQTKRIINTHNELNSSNQENQSISGSNSVVPNIQHVQGLKLPPIILNKFSGDYKNWLEFRDLFDSLINSNSSIQDIQKFHYLRTSLEGSAAQVIAGIELSGGNYLLAWNTLCSRFENKSILVQNHVKALFNLRTLSVECSSELRYLIDNTLKHVTSLKSLNQPCDSWDTLLIYIVGGKLDKVTSREWEQKKASNTSDTLPTFSEFMNFLKSRADFLENLELSKVKPEHQGVNKPKFEHKFSSKSFAVQKLICKMCSGSHPLHKCSEFLKLNITTRLEKVKQFKVCFNCLQTGHSYSSCNSHVCNKCKLKHNTLLHFDRKRENSSEETTSNEPALGNAVSLNLSSGIRDHSQVLLQTALVQIVDSNGVPQVCRALLDGGSQSNFITKKCCERLGLQKLDLPSTVTGVGQVITHLRHRCQLTVHSLKYPFQVDLSCLVIPKISENYPTFNIDKSNWQIPNHINLADPGFAVSSEIDLLIGSGVYLSLLCIGQIKLGQRMPILHKNSVWMDCGW